MLYGAKKNAPLIAEANKGVFLLKSTMNELILLSNWVLYFGT
jgi:hypothetical protein